MEMQFPLAATASVSLVVASVMSIHSPILRKIWPSRTANTSAALSLLVSLYALFQLVDKNSGFVFLIPFAIATYFVIYIDIQTQRIPNFINLLLALSMTIAAVVWKFSNLDWQIFPIFAGGITLFIIYLALNLLSGNRLGMGDVKLAYAAGMASGSFGISGIILSTLFAFALSGMFALGLLVTKKANLKSEFAFGPFMILGTWLSLLMLSSFV